MVGNASRVAFIFPPAGDAIMCRHHLGVAYIQAYLAKYGIASEQVIPDYGSTLDDYVEQAIETRAEIIGFTCYDYNYHLVRSISKLIKRQEPNCLIAAGGPTATFSDELILKDASEIDLCVRFEGEETTLELVNHLQEGSYDFKDIKGITYRQGNSIIRNQDRELIGSRNGDGYDLDVLPSPYLGGILEGTEGAGILTSRGCTHRCAYCNFSAISKHTVRHHSVDRIMSELHHIQKSLERWPHSTIFINDDDFSINIPRAKEICRRIIDEDIKLDISCLCRADNVDEELVQLLSKAGISKLIFGLESASPKVLRNIKKISQPKSEFEKETFAPEKKFLSKAKEAISLAKKYNMESEVSIILGLPGESFEDGLETVEFVRSLGVNAYSQNYLVVYRGTELFDTARSYGIKIKPSPSLLPYDIDYSYPVEEVPFLYNSSLQMDLLEKARTVLRAFAGGPDTCSGSENGIAVALIEMFDNMEALKIFPWLAQHLAVRGVVAVLGKESNTFEDSEAIINLSYKSGLPTHRFYHLRNISSKNSGIIYEIINKPLKGKLLQWNLRFPQIELRNGLEFMKRHRAEGEQDWLVYCLATREDVLLLAAIAHSLKHMGNKNGTDFWLNGVFQDGCRWCEGPCPALKLQRVVINNMGEVLPCINGQPLGTVADSLRDLRNKAREAYEKVLEERRCIECPAALRCSKCLFPYPLSSKEYCELQRADLGLSKIVSRSKMANMFVNLNAEDI